MKSIVVKVTGDKRIYSYEICRALKAMFNADFKVAKCRPTLKKINQQCKSLPPKYRKLMYLYAGMKQRCYNKNNNFYWCYGGKGIRVCKEWYYNSASYYLWAILNGYREGLVIDRIDNNKGYSPDNCRWVSEADSLKNKHNTHVMITHNGITMSRTAWANKIGISRDALTQRINDGWSIERALGIPTSLGTVSIVKKIQNTRSKPIVMRREKARTHERKG